jgi:putative MATE family efflux protein
MDDKRINLMKNEKVSKAVNKMAAPAIIGMLVMAIYNIVDSIFVSHIGGNEIAATQVVLPLMLIASSIGLAFGIGGGSYVSRLLGANKKKEANIASAVAFFTALGVGVALTIFNFIFMDEVLLLFGADESILELAKQYGNFIVFGYAFTVLNMVLNNILRSEGSGNYSMIGMAVGSVLNIILDPIFIFVFDWGIAGAAIATTVSQIVSFGVLFSNFFYKRSLVHLKAKYFLPSKEIYKQIFVVGLPTFLKQMLISVSIGLLNTAAMKYGGADLLASVGIVTRVIMIPNYIIFGFGQGFQPLAGYNFGAKNKERVIEGFKYTLFVTTIITTITCILFFLLDDIIFRIYDASPAITSYGKTALHYYSIGMLFLGITNTITVFYQALGRGVEALIMSISRQGILYIIAIILLPRFLGVEGVLLTQTVSDIASFLLALAMVIPFTKSNKIELLMQV